MNLLSEGKIPKNTICPFTERCSFKSKICPTSEETMKIRDFSCAAARLHEMMVPSNA